MKRILFYCQHLVGIGHLVRSSAISQALAKDFSVLFVSGGPPVNDFRLPENIQTLQLPAIESDPEFQNIRASDPSSTLEETKERRKKILLDLIESFEPGILITELFPFGRKQFHFELLPLLEKARSRSGDTVIACSVRDLLVRKNDSHERLVCEILNNSYDVVLVHGDERLHGLDQTFSRAAEVTCPIEYTGFVARSVNGAAPPETPAGDGRRHPGIVVSVGAGRYVAGGHLLRTAIQAAALLQDRIPQQFHIFAGPLVEPESYRELERMAQPAPNVNLSRYAPNFSARLKSADLSISLGGYNTLMDILSTGVRALVLPITAHGDQEQTIRAEALEKLGVLQVLSADLTPEAMSATILRALEMKPANVSFNLNGAENSARILREFVEKREGNGSTARSGGKPVLERTNVQLSGM